MKMFALLFITGALFAQGVDQQQPLTWVKRHTVRVPYEAVRCYENVIPWINPLQEIHLHSGHLGLPVLTTDWSEPLQTNQTWAYTFASDTFLPIYPWLRPPKRCGGKGIYDEGAGRVLFHGGSHRVYCGYGEIAPAGNSIAQNDEERNLWAFNPETRQWYDMRPLKKELATATDAFFKGYSFNVAYAKEYGLMLLNAGMGKFIQSYSAHFNRWMYFGKSGSLLRKEYRGASYDLRRHALVIAGSDTETTVFQMGANTWERKSYSLRPTNAYEWYGGCDAVSYDENTGKHLLVRGDGAAVYTLDLADSSGWRPLAVSGAPPSAGHLGANLHYARELNLHYLYSAIGSELWTFRLSETDTLLPMPPLDVRSRTTTAGIVLSWQAPRQGPPPDQYYLYRTNWVPSYSGSIVVGLEPGAYVKIDSTSGLEIAVPVSFSASESYSYYVSSVSRGRESVPSAPAFSTPEVPMGLVATVRSPKRVDLKWKRHAGADITGYNVYRAMGDSTLRFRFVRLNAGPVVRHVFSDTALTLVPGGVFANYAVTAVNLLGYESGFSPLAYSAPDPMPGLWVDTVNMRFVWNKSLCDTVAGYQVIAAAKSGDYWDYFAGGGSPWTTLGAVTRDTFAVITSLENAYGVRAVNVLGQRGFYSDFVPCADRGLVNLGWFRGDGRFAPPAPDTFWNDIGLGEIRVEQGRSLFVDDRLDLTCAPNPFNPSVRISVRPGKGARITILDIRGRIIRDLSLPDGLFTWDGTDAGKRPASSGMYLVSVKTPDGKSAVRNIVLQR